jgi:hypothetical protein
MGFSVKAIDFQRVSFPDCFKLPAISLRVPDNSSCALINRHAVTRKKTNPANAISMQIQLMIASGRYE